MAARKNLKKPTKPEPVAVTTICSVCGLSWLGHGKDPTTDDCIRLLKEELATRPITVPQPYPVPVRPYRPWYWEEWHQKKREPFEITWSGTNETTYGGESVKEHTPRLLTSTCQESVSPSL
jgi:hypothetical protein